MIGNAIIFGLRFHSSFCRDVAQFGSALDWGSRGRRFKSCRPDQEEQNRLRAVFSFLREDDSLREQAILTIYRC